MTPTRLHSSTGDRSSVERGLRKAALDQRREDCRQSSAPSLDYKTLCDATADLKSRASRIKFSIPLLQVVDKGEKLRYDEDPDPDHLASKLPELSRLINSFLAAPSFASIPPTTLRFD